MTTLKEQDADRFFLSLFIKDRAKREAIQILDLFYLEIAHIQDVVKTPHMGLIRLRWWADEIARIYNGKHSAAHLVLSNLKPIIEKYSLPQNLFDELIDARQADFDEGGAFDIYQYAHTTHLPIMKLKALVLGEDTESIAPLSDGYALAGLLRSAEKTKEEKIEIGKEAERLLGLSGSNHCYFRAHRALAEIYLTHLNRHSYKIENLPPVPFKELRILWGSKFC